MANTVMAKMAVQIMANTAEFSKALNKTSKDITGFTNEIKSVASAIGLAFGAQQVASFALDIAKLAGEADGVRTAFNKFPQSTKLLNELKTATSGTVSELDLMKRTVQGTNFGISLGALPKLLEFAAVRAQQTGQSVDYLVDSIVTGIGRKSPLILDNLGISAVALKEKLDGVSIAQAEVGQVADAVGKIAEESLKQMGSLTDTTATKVQNLTAEWTNLKVAMGDLINEAGGPEAVGFFTKYIQGWTSLIKGGAQYGDVLRDLNLTLDAFNAAQPHGKEFLDYYDKLEKKAEEAGVKLVLLTDSVTGLRKVMIDPRTPFIDGNKTATEGGKVIVTLESLKAKLTELNEQFSTTDTIDKKKLANIGSEIISTELLIKKLEELKKAQAELGRGANLTSTQRKEFEKPLELRKMGSAIGTLIAPKEVEDELKEQIDRTVKNIKRLPEAMGEIKQEMIDISGLIVGGIVDIATAFGEAAVTGAQDFGRTFIRALGRFAQQFGALLIATGIGEKALKFGGPGAKIAAGVALVALGSAITALMSNKPSLSGGGGGSGGAGSRGGDFFIGGHQSVIIEGNFRIDGRDLVLAYDKNKSLDSKRR